MMSDHRLTLLSLEMGSFVPASQASDMQLGTGGWWQCLGVLCCESVKLCNL